MKKTVARIIAFVLVIAMLAGCAFYLVYIISDASLPGGYVVYASESEDNAAYARLDKLREVIDTINRNYKEKVDIKTLVDGAYRGVFEQLDPYSEYYSTVEEEQNFTSKLAEGVSYGGIGITFSKDAGHHVIQSVNVNGPAYSAGVKAGDIIYKIEGKEVSTWTSDDVATKLRGEEGTSVSFTVLRNDKEYDFTLARAVLTASDVSCKMLSDDTAYISISVFSSGVYYDFLQDYFAMFEEGANNFIIDLRGNIGGYMEEALQCAAALLTPGDELITYTGQQGVYENYTVTGDEQPYDFDFVILVDENTASASEAFACAMKENKAATIVGLTTYGKGCAQQIFQLDDETSYKLSCYWFSGPKNTKIDGVGVVPDYIVFNNGGFTSDEALEISSKVLPMAEQKKYTVYGSYGLNIVAAQQRLAVLGYDVDVSGYLDYKTIEALKVIQKNAGGYPCGDLDFFTQRAVCNAFNAYVYGTEDLQLAKALEILK